MIYLSGNHPLCAQHEAKAACQRSVEQMRRYEQPDSITRHESGSAPQTSSRFETQAAQEPDASTTGAASSSTCRRYPTTKDRRNKTVTRRTGDTLTNGGNGGASEAAAGPGARVGTRARRYRWDVLATRGHARLIGLWGLSNLSRRCSWKSACRLGPKVHPVPVTMHHTAIPR